MTNNSGQRVRLSIMDWVAIVGLLVGQLMVLGGIGVAMWTHLAVLSEKVDNQEKSISELRTWLKER